MCGGTIHTGLLVVSYATYLLLGTIGFWALEKNAEKELKMAVIQMKEAFLQNFTHLTVAEVEQFVKNLTDAVQRGIYPVGNESQTEVSNWDLSNSFFFVGAVVSTIGYGTLCPKTSAGQIFCVFFASFGIPFNIVFLHRVSKMLSLLCERLGRWLYEKGMKKKKIKFLTLLFFLVMGILVFLCLPSFVFQVVEGWSYSEGVYFAFITLSTIGFGDYVVGKQPDRNYPSYYRSLVAIWIIFGLAWIALLFNLLTTLLEDTEKKIAQDLHKMRKAGKDNEENQKRYQPAGFVSAEEPSLLGSGGDAQKTVSLATHLGDAKQGETIFSL
ncbi:potassium channel, subfamily K, member 16-like isoform X1 [Caretta caretta]|uniref:potassium channel, subfamily K, member 16-like isoform X1 n=1 Tax=Caretta caretta TaxID=8467 RepID=UPI0020941797|nr:potassium channel subfamily K member 16-like [Caretta caretta]